MEFTVSGVLFDACILGVLSAAPAYGYELTQKTKKALNVSESAMYPVLRRLLKNGMLSSYDEPFDGRNRKYYKLTEEGEFALSEYRGMWELYKATLDNLLNWREQE